MRCSVWELSESAVVRAKKTPLSEVGMFWMLLNGIAGGRGGGGPHGGAEGLQRGEGSASLPPQPLRVAELRARVTLSRRAQVKAYCWLMACVLPQMTWRCTAVSSCSACCSLRAHEGDPRRDDDGADHDEHEHGQHGGAARGRAHDETEDE